MLVYGECECFVMQMLYVCVLCASCGSSQCCVLHDMQFVKAGRGCNRRPYIRYSVGSGVNRMQVGLSRFSKRLFCFVPAKTVCRYGCMYFLAALVLVCVDVIVMSST